MRIRDKGRSAPGAMSKEFMESARAYLSEAFPNPDRAGCPPGSALRSLAFNPRESDATRRRASRASPLLRRSKERCEWCGGVSRMETEQAAAQRLWQDKI